MPESAALLFIDVVDSTLTTQRLGDARALALWTEHDRRARELLRRHGGREIDRADGYLLLFDGADAAARYALDYHASIATLGLAARAGLHVGPVTLRRASDDDVDLGAKRVEVEGLAKPLAARVMAMAHGGQTLLSADARQALAAAPPIPDADLHGHGHYRLKGIDEPVEVFELGLAARCSFTPPADVEKSYRVVRADGLWQPVREIARHLPAERDAFVGREADLRAIARQLDGGTRLLTLLGAGGSGKTRLAIRYGRGWVGDWPGGVWFVDLSDALSTDALHYAVARVLGVRLGGGDATAQLGEAIAGRGRCLIDLDNFEQLVPHAVATVGPWLERAPEAAFVVTSRERLSLPGEAVQPVGPLPLDGPAIELFEARARALQPGFVLDTAQRGAVADLVALLDGLPLAIELAAARITVLSPAQLLARLGDRFRLLAGRSHGGRQATLRATIDWSWQLLAAWEQAALEQCSAFDGGFTLAAAEAVIDLSAWSEAPLVIDAVQALVDKSLLRRWLPADAPTRHDLEEPYFGMYLSIHEYAAEKCRLRGDADYRALQERHGRCYAAFGSDEAIEALSLRGGTQRSAALRQELANLIAACRRAVARGDGAVAVGCYRAAWEVLALQGPFAAAVSLGEAVCAMDGLDVRDAEAARLSLADALVRVGATEAMEARLAAGLSRVRAVGDRKLEGRIVGRLGNLCLWGGRLDEAGAHYAAALACFRDVGNRLLEARMLGNLAIVAHEHGQGAQALALYEQALEIERAIGDRRDEAITLCNFADLLAVQDRPERAREAFAAALAVLRELGDRDTEAVTLQQLGEFELDQGRIDFALESLHAGLALTHAVGNRRVRANVLRSLAGTWIAHGELDHAQQALDEALAITRAAPNRRLEAQLAATQTQLALRRGRVADAASEALRAEAVLRELDDRPALAELLCLRGHVDLAHDQPALARTALNEAEQIAAAMKAGVASGLQRRIEHLRSALPAGD